MNVCNNKLNLDYIHLYKELGIKLVFTRFLFSWKTEPTVVREPRPVRAGTQPWVMVSA